MPSDPKWRSFRRRALVQAFEVEAEMFVSTAEGTMWARKGDWVVRSTPRAPPRLMRAREFHDMYEPV